MHDIGGAVNLPGIGGDASQGVRDRDDCLVGCVRNQAAATQDISCSADHSTTCDIAAAHLLDDHRSCHTVVSVERIAAEGRLYIGIGAACVISCAAAVATVGNVLREVWRAVVVDVQQSRRCRRSATGVRHLGGDRDRPGFIQDTRRQGRRAGTADAGIGFDAVRLDRRTVGSRRSVYGQLGLGFAIHIQPPAVDRGIAVDGCRAHGGKCGDHTRGSRDRKRIGPGSEGAAAGVQRIQRHRGGAAGC